MRIRHVATVLVGVAGASVTALALSGLLSRDPVPPAIAQATLWMPDPLAPPRIAETNSVRPALAQADVAFEFRPVPPLPASPADTSLPSIEPPLVIWSREIASGETLDAVLDDAGLAAFARAEIAQALGSEYDLRQLRPGHSVTVESSPNGTPRRVELAVADGLRIVTVLGDTPDTRVLEPEPEIVTFAGQAVVESSIYAALQDAGLPARFAVDLAQMLASTADLRRDLAGGEVIRLLWREARDGNQRIGQPELTFAALELGDSTYEIVWPDDESGQATIFLDGTVLQVFTPPVEGARLSSAFGNRVHPIYGNVRMHTGVDFSAPSGAPVRATAPGRISYVGWRGGYGRVVEVAHGANTITRYTHLSAVPEGLAPGQRVMAGDMIGRVGATGTATGPNLHYEVMVNGRPTDPLADNRLAEALERETDVADKLTQLSAARSLLAERLARETTPATTERL
ncbi:MAG: M23 family metallopeptidase [Alterinioella nitratireducens]|uniref:M23 family metallopeptidase n=1 Tax=Alterinioella nitratireducens TaxID=2735915 RepID=UPI004059C1C9